MNPRFEPTKAPSSDETSDEKTEGTTLAKAPNPVTPKPRRPRGFAAMDRKRVSEIASKGGKAAHAAGTAHQFTSDEARAAGHKGGVAPHVRRGRGERQPHADTTVAPQGTEAPASSGAP